MALWILIFLALSALSGCDGNGDFPTSSSNLSHDITVNVALSEWAMTPDKTTVNAGPVTFNVTNNGPADVHNLMIVKTDLAPADLPVDDNGNVDENGADITIIGKVGDNIKVGENAQANFYLEPGNYVLICNIWDAGEQEAHFTEGMFVAFIVQ